MSKDDRIDAIAHALRTGVIKHADMNQYGVQIPRALWDQRVANTATQEHQPYYYFTEKMVRPALVDATQTQMIIEEHKAHMAEKLAQSVFGKEAEMASRTTLDLGFKGKPPVHQPLWDKISEECQALIEVALEKGLELIEPDPHAYTAAGQTTRPIVYMGSYVWRIFKEDMQRAYGGEKGEVRLGGCRVTNDMSIDDDMVFILCQGVASVASMLTQSKKNDWAYKFFTYDQPALASGNSTPEEVEASDEA